MGNFLIDVNLPYYFSIWDSPEYLHQIDIDDTWTDSQIWDFSKERNLTIITKDTDFTNKVLVSEPPPKVIHIKVGNYKLKEFHALLTKIWSEVIEMNKENKLVTVYTDRIEGIKSNPE
jgi:predicted nuclease of predicted toxin-antitoxin system